MREGYDIAQVCLNGHIITMSAEAFPASCKDYCSKCGEKTIMSCSTCNAPLEGRRKGSRMVYTPEAPQACCYNCGRPYPWTERALTAAAELVDLEESISREERQALKDDLVNLTSDTPRTSIAVLKMKRWLSKAKPAAASAMRDTLIALVSEAAKKALLP